MNNNMIQRNIMIVGSVESIEKILKEKKDKINIYKCCLIKNDNISSLEKARMILKIPVFTDETEMRVILEYHELGQIWILDNEEKNLVNYFLDLVIKFSVDIFIVNFKDNSKNNSNLPSDNLINNKYSYSNYQTSRFYGFDLFIKIFLDKIFSILFLLLLSPIFILAMMYVFIVGWIGISWYVRGEFYREKAKDYVSAAISMGQSTWKIMFKHILPNALTPIITFTNLAKSEEISLMGWVGLFDFQKPGSSRLNTAKYLSCFSNSDQFLYLHRLSF